MIKKLVLIMFMIVSATGLAFGQMKPCDDYTKCGMCAGNLVDDNGDCWVDENGNWTGGITGALCIAADDYLYFNCPTNTVGLRWNSTGSVFDFTHNINIPVAAVGTGNIRFTGASNGDIGYWGFIDNAVAGNSDLYIKLPGNYTAPIPRSSLYFYDSIDQEIARLEDTGNLILMDELWADGVCLLDPAAGVGKELCFESMHPSGHTQQRVLYYDLNNADRNIHVYGNDVYLDQDYRTTADVIFNGIDLNGDVDIDFNALTEEFKALASIAISGGETRTYTPYTFESKISASGFGDELQGAVVDFIANNDFTLFATDNQMVARFYSGVAPTAGFAGGGDVLIENELEVMDKAYLGTAWIGNVSQTKWIPLAVDQNGVLFNSDYHTITDTGVAATRAYRYVNTFWDTVFESTNAVTITDAATIWVSGPPEAGTNTTITNPYTLWIDRGVSRLDGDVIIGSTLKTHMGIDVASANSMTLGDGNFFDITGVVTINTIATKAIGTFVVLEFDGILQLTHSADLVLPSAANITTAAGDIAVFYEYATADWRCMSYSRADGTPISGGGLVTWVPAGGDIEAYITAATAGDTLVLDGSTYTITDDIDIAKAITIIGLGINETIITCSAVSKNVFDIAASDVNISNMSIVSTGGSAKAFIVNDNFDDIVISGIDISLSGTGSQIGIYVGGSNADIRDVVMIVYSSDGVAWGVGTLNWNTTTQDIVTNCYNVKATVQGQGASGNPVYGFRSYNNNDANTVTLNCYNCQSFVTADHVDNQGRALAVQSSTTNTAVGVAYNCIFDGDDYDAIQDGTNSLTLYASTLNGNLTSGTITTTGTIRTGGLVASGNVAGATYGSDGSVSDAELLVLDDGAVTELLVGGGAGSAPVWTTATGSGAPVRATAPTITNVTLNGTASTPGNANEANLGYDYEVLEGATPDAYEIFYERPTIDVDPIADTTITMHPAGSFQHMLSAKAFELSTDARLIVPFTVVPAEGTPMGDHSGLGHTMTYHGTWIKGRQYVSNGLGWGIKFDGVDDYAEADDAADLSFGNSTTDSAFSVAAWIYVVANASYQTIVSKNDTVTGVEKREWSFLLGTTGTLQFQLADESAASPWVARSSTSAITAGEWVFVAATYDGTGGEFALDGTNCVMYFGEADDKYTIANLVYASTATTNAAYVAMENTAATVRIGANTGTDGNPDKEFFGSMGLIYIDAVEWSGNDVYKLFLSTRAFYEGN